MNTDVKPKVSLTGILIQDTEGGGFTAFFAEFPEAVAEGETELEVQKNLFAALSNVLEVKKDDFPDQVDGHKFITKSFNLELSA